MFFKHPKPLVPCDRARLRFTCRPSASNLCCVLKKLVPFLCSRPSASYPSLFGPSPTKSCSNPHLPFDPWPFPLKLVMKINKSMGMISAITLCQYCKNSEFQHFQNPGLNGSKLLCQRWNQILWDVKPDCILCRSKRFRVGSSGLQWVLLLCKEPFDGGSLWWSLWFCFIPIDSSALLAAVQTLLKRVLETSSLAVSLCFALNSHPLSQFSTQILPGLYQWREERGGSRRILWMWFVACGYWRISNFGVTSVGWFKGASAIVLFMSHELSSCIIDYTSVIVIKFNFN